MKKLFVLFIFSVAVTFSVFSQAEPITRVVQAPVYQAEFDSESSVIWLQGFLPTPCAVSPHPTLELEPSTGELILSVEAHEMSSGCMTVLGGSYEMAFDVRSLKYQLRELQLDTEATYTLKTKNNTLRFEISFANVPDALPYSTKTFRSVELNSDQGQFNVTSKGNTYEISSPFIDTEKFLGQTVDLQGHVVDVKTTGFDFNRPSSQPIFIVTGINVTVH